MVAWALMLVSYMHEMLRNNHLFRVRLGIVKKILGMLTDSYLLTLILCIFRGHEIQFYEKLRCRFCTVKSMTLLFSLYVSAKAHRF